MTTWYHESKEGSKPSQRSRQLVKSAIGNWQSTMTSRLCRILDDHVINAQRGRSGSLQISQRFIVIGLRLQLAGARSCQLILALKHQKRRRAAHVVKLL